MLGPPHPVFSEFQEHYFLFIVYTAVIITQENQHRSHATTTKALGRMVTKAITTHRDHTTKKTSG